METKTIREKRKWIKDHFSKGWNFHRCEKAMLQKKLGSTENESRTNIKKGKRKKERTADKKRKVN